MQNAVNMRIAAPKLREIIDKCDTFLGSLKSSPTFRNNAQIYRSFGSELKEMMSNIESIVDNQSASNRKLNVGNTSYVKKRIEKAKILLQNFQMYYLVDMCTRKSLAEENGVFMYPY